MINDGFLLCRHLDACSNLAESYELIQHEMPAVLKVIMHVANLQQRIVGEKKEVEGVVDE